MASVVQEEVQSVALWELNLPFLLSLRIEVYEEYVASRLCQEIGLLVEWFVQKSDLSKSRSIVRLERKQEAKARDDFSNKNFCYLWGSFWPCRKSFNPPWEGIHFSNTFSMSFILCVGGMCVKSICQSFPGMWPRAWCVRNAGMGLELPGVRRRNTQ